MIWQMWKAAGQGQDAKHPSDCQVAVEQLFGNLVLRE